MAYSRKDTKSNREAYGNYMLASSYSHRVYNPKAKAGDKRTEIRVLPAYDEASGQFMPQVVPVDGLAIEGIGDSFHSCEQVSMLGTRKYQYVTETSDFPDKISPTKMFFNAIQNFVKDNGRKANQEWADWCGKTGGLSLPSHKMMMQGLLYKHDGASLLDKQGNRTTMLVVLSVQRSATMDIEAKLTTVVGPGDLSTQNSIMGDITSPASGKPLIIEGYLNGEGKERYRAFAADNIYPLSEEYCAKSFVPWDKLLRVETAAWQIARLLETFDAESVDYAFGKDADYAKFIPEQARGAFWHKADPTKVSQYTKTSAPNQAVEDDGDGLTGVPPPPPPQQAPAYTPSKPSTYMPPPPPPYQAAAPTTYAPPPPPPMAHAPAAQQAPSPTANRIMESLRAAKEGAAAKAGTV